MVVTRFAPSPTGYLHIGGARTALFNWLLARKTNGRFLLRIEDTDQKRNTPEAAKQVMDDLRWLGIEWDEGPDVGGPNGPYSQSERLDIYKKYMDKLLAQGKAYYCFDTPEELKAMRDEAQKQKKSLIYRAPDVLPTKSDVEKARSQGRPVTVRFATPMQGDIVVNDQVRGDVTFAAREIGDFIIQKSDGFPTYHFACVVDDELMQVTHVIRGQEHLMNTPGHQALQDALGFRRPVYLHMSVTVSESGGKLSKRERPKALRKKIKERPDIDMEELAGIAKISDAEMGEFVNKNVSPPMPAIDAIAGYLGVHLPEINVVDFFKSGYLPEAMVNFIALLGWNPGDEREVMPVDELIDAFDSGRLTKANSLFDRQKLIAFNTEHIRTLPMSKLSAHFRDYLKVIDSDVARADDALLEKIIKINAGARTLEDIEKKSRFIFIDNDNVQYDEKAVKKVLLKHDGLAILREIGCRLAKMDEITPEITPEMIEGMLRTLAEEKQVGLGKVAQPLRVAICGTTVSPPIFDSVNILGIKSTLRRIENTLEKFETQV
ncbi:MAG: glutamate--tRNA ligase [Planctomycetota bacterium]|jgi:glutamyl-tRNA synthetase